jgi:putative sterol carrier protein
MSANHTQEDAIMAITTVKEALDGLVRADPAKVAGINAVILFDLSGEEGGKWTLKLADGKIELKEGETTPPAMTLSMSAQDFVAMTNGDLNPMAAFMQGKIRITGDMSLAMRLQSILA